MPAADPVLELLRDVELFEGVPAKKLKAVRSLGKEVWFAPGQTITKEGEKGGRFFLILSGQARLYIGNRTRSSAVLGRGDTVGEMSLLDGEPRMATVLATTEVETWSLVPWHFRGLLREEPAIMEHLIKVLCRRLRTAQRPSAD